MASFAAESVAVTAPTGPGLPICLTYEAPTR